jgi:hypothetical protein
MRHSCWQLLVSFLLFHWFLTLCCLGGHLLLLRMTLIMCILRRLCLHLIRCRERGTPSQVETNAAALQLETSAADLELEMDATALKLEADMAGLKLETDVPQETSKQERYLAD